MNSKYPSKPKKVPSSRISRLANFGGLAGSIAGNLLKNTGKQILKGEAPSLSGSLLTEQNAISITDKLAKMRGAAMKVGQLFSMDTGELLPAEWEPILARLRQQADHMPKSQLLSALKNAWGDNWFDQFEYFSFDAIAAASIGQVHKARLNDGTELAIKVQYPGVKKSIDSDIDNVASLIKLSGMLPKHVDINPLLSKAKVQLHEEADYLKEAQHMMQYAKLVAEQADFEIPKVFSELSTDSVLCMSFLSGKPLESARSQGDIDFICEAIFKLSLSELFEHKLMQSDPNFANFLFDEDKRTIQLLDFGATRNIDASHSELYLALANAMQLQDKQKISTLLTQLGLIDEHMSAQSKDIFTQACMLAGKCLQSDDYNFKQSGLLQKIKSITQPLIENKDATATPDFEVALINRKMTGIVMLANKMGASLNLKSMLAKYQ